MNILLITTLVLDLSRIFIEFFLKPVYPTMVAKKFKFMVLRLLENTVVSKKLNLFAHAPKQKSPPGFYYYYSRQKKITYFPQTKCFENQFFPSREREHYGAENIIKVKLARVLVTSFNKFHSTICNLYFFGFCFVVP